MKMAEELQRELRSINRKSYPAYKGLKGAYQFPDYQLFIEHVQGDPFAAPSALRIFVPHSKAKFPERYYWDCAGHPVQPGPTPSRKPTRAGDSCLRYAYCRSETVPAPQ